MPAKVEHDYKIKQNYLRDRQTDRQTDRLTDRHTVYSHQNLQSTNTHNAHTEKQKTNKHHTLGAVTISFFSCYATLTKHCTNMQAVLKVGTDQS